MSPHVETGRAEARLRSIFDATPVPLMLLDADDSIHFVNPAFTRTFGFTASALPTLTAWWARACPNPDYREVMADAWKSLVLSTGGADVAPLAMEVEIVCGDGAAKTVLASPARLDPEERGDLMMVLHDITDRKSAEEQSRRSETLMRIAGQTTGLGGWTIDLPEYRITWSDEACLLHGFPPGTAPTFDQALALYLPEEGQRLRSALRACAASGQPFDLECEGVGPSGAQVFMRTLGQAERDARGNIRRVHGALLDITRKKQAEAELTHATEAMRASLAEKEALAEEVDLAAYLRALATLLQRVRVVERGKIGFDLDLSPARVSLHQAIACGLIVNELVSNALKHDLGGAERIRISLKPLGGELRLRVAGSEAGRPGDIDSSQVAADLARQLPGRLDVSAAEGVTLDVTFTPSPPEPRDEPRTRSKGMLLA